MVTCNPNLQSFTADFTKFHNIDAACLYLFYGSGCELHCLASQEDLHTACRGESLMLMNLLLHTEHYDPL